MSRANCSFPDFSPLKEKKEKSQSWGDSARITGRLDARRKFFVHISVGKELDPTNPRHPCAAITRLETGHNTQRTARPESLATALCSVEQHFVTRIRIRIGREALGRGVKDGNQQRVVAMRERDAREPYGRSVGCQERML
jgi:hypothetical protein